MLNKLTIAAILTAIVAATASAAPAPRATAKVPATSAQSWQDLGNAEDMGIIYRR